jgi:hypothetical protein
VHIDNIVYETADVISANEYAVFLAVSDAPAAVDLAAGRASGNNYNLQSGHGFCRAFRFIQLS